MLRFPTSLGSVLLIIVVNANVHSRSLPADGHGSRAQNRILWCVWNFLRIVIWNIPQNYPRRRIHPSGSVGHCRFFDKLGNILESVCSWPLSAVVSALIASVESFRRPNHSVHPPAQARRRSSQAQSQPVSNRSVPPPVERFPPRSSTCGGDKLKRLTGTPRTATCTLHDSPVGLCWSVVSLVGGLLYPKIERDRASSTRLCIRHRPQLYWCHSLFDDVYHRSCVSGSKFTDPTTNGRGGSVFGRFALSRNLSDTKGTAVF